MAEYPEELHEEIKNYCERRHSVLLSSHFERVHLIFANSRPPPSRSQNLGRTRAG
jgi:hypothetical protein